MQAPVWHPIFNSKVTHLPSVGKWRIDRDETIGSPEMKSLHWNGLLARAYSENWIPQVTCLFCCRVPCIFKKYKLPRRFQSRQSVLLCLFGSSVINFTFASSCDQPRMPMRSLTWLTKGWNVTFAKTAAKVPRDLSLPSAPLQHDKDGEQRLLKPVLLLSGERCLDRKLHWMGRERRGIPASSAWKPDNHCWQCCHGCQWDQLGWRHFLRICLHIKTIQIHASPNPGILGMFFSQRHLTQAEKPNYPYGHCFRLRFPTTEADGQIASLELYSSKSVRIYFRDRINEAKSIRCD